MNWRGWSLPQGIYFVTDPVMSAPAGGVEEQIEATARQVQAAVQAGVRVVQLRWKPCDAGPFLKLVRATATSQAAIIINDRVDVFLAAREEGLPVAGVHVGQSDLPPKLVRQMIGEQAHLGWSAATASEISTALSLRDVIDVIGVGVVRDTATKPDAPPPLGVRGIADIAADFPLPVVAIGGITAADIPLIAPTDIHCAAVVSAIAAAPDANRAAQELVTAWNAAQKGHP